MSDLATDPDDPAAGGNIIGGDPPTYHPALWSFLIDRFSIKSTAEGRARIGETGHWTYFIQAGLIFERRSADDTISSGISR
jgi:hypothetical protein